MAITLLRPVYVRFGANIVSEHNRSPVEVDYERIRQTTRVASGRMRQQYIADKRNFSISWEMLPETAASTVDGAWGAQEIINFYNSTSGPFTLGLMQSNNTTVTNYTVLFSDFSATPVKRWGTYYYDIDVSLEEV